MCRDKELVMLAYILPSPEKNADGAYIDAVGRTTTLEALRDEAPIGMAYMADGFCLGF